VTLGLQLHQGNDPRVISVPRVYQSKGSSSSSNGNKHNRPSQGFMFPTTSVDDVLVHVLSQHLTDLSQLDFVSDCDDAEYLSRVYEDRTGNEVARMLSWSVCELALQAFGKC
jgi:hypothetical protein